jgi:3-oxoacyl-[acyl-carrier-protein] synthase-3
MPVVLLPAHNPALASRLFGLGSAQPAHRVTAAELGRRFGKSAAWVEARTGIRELRRVRDRRELPDLARSAAVRALADAHIAASEVDLVLAASCSATHRQSLAARVAADLGTPGGHLDLNAACSGFCYALASADALIRAGSARYVLVVAAESMSSIIDADDLATSVVFGDGAGAAVVGPVVEGDPGIGPTVWGSDGARGDLIDFDGSGRYLRMRGQEVFRWAVDAAPDIAYAACERAKVGLRDIDVFIPHQANLRIIDAVVRRLDFRHDVVVATDVVESGNTSAASVPIALDKVRRQHRLPRRATALLVGFGAGLAHAAQVVRLP